MFLGWTAEPGRVYRVQSTTNLAAPFWIEQGTNITSGLTGDFLDDQPAPAARFYRVWTRP